MRVDKGVEWKALTWEGNLGAVTGIYVTLPLGKEPIQNVILINVLGCYKHLYLQMS